MAVGPKIVCIASITSPLGFGISAIALGCPLRIVNTGIGDTLMESLAIRAFHAMPPLPRLVLMRFLGDQYRSIRDCHTQ